MGTKATLPSRTKENGPPGPDSSTAEEERWIRAAQQGDREAFAHLIEQYWPRLYRWLYQMTHNRHLAEDMAQETFLKALAHLKRFEAGTNFRAWLFRIAYNTMANQQRSAGRERAPLSDELPDRQQAPPEEASQRELLANLARAAADLPPDFRAAFLLRVEEQLSFRQIAEVLAITEETARWRVFKVRQGLLEKLEPQLEREKP